MKKTFSILMLFLLITTPLLAQKNKKTIEVLYFKANLCSCRSRVCTAVGKDIQSVIEELYPDNSVIFSEVKIADKANKELVTKYNAKSQTLILLKEKKRKEVFLDISELVQKYSKDKDKQAFEDGFKSKMVELKKLKK